MLFFVRRCHDRTPLLDEAVIFGGERDLRNKAVHTYLSIPQVTAEQVYQKVKANLEDFVQNWQKFMRPPTIDVNLNDSQRFEIVNWELLCKWCKINEFLPPIKSETDRGI